MTGLSFGNPYGFLALLGIPAVVLIHLLQIRSRLVRTSTLFLLEPRSFEREGGRNIERLRTSPLFWLQLAAVVVATWLLVQPQWLREDTTLRVVLVMDGSASMSTFRDATREALSSYLPKLEKSARHIEWIVLGSDPAAPTLFSGNDRASAVTAALDWRSYLGVHEMDESVDLASSIAGPRGLVVVVTDHRIEVPPGVELVAVGQPLDNVGLVSVAFDSDRTWRAIVKSSATSSQTRSWWLEVEGVPVSRATIDLEPGEVRFLESALPPDVDRAVLALESDAFALDDRLPFLVPLPKTLAVHVAPALEQDAFVRGFLGALEPVQLVPSSEADLSIGGASREGGTGASISFGRPGSGFRQGPAFELRRGLADRLRPKGYAESRRSEAEAEASRGGGPIIVEHHPLVEGLDFRGLVARSSAPLALGENDRVLVWQGDEALLVLGDDGRSPTLRAGFALEESNADRIPAFVLALHRFAATVRERKRTFYRDNVETRQTLTISADITERAPNEPGFFEIARDGEVRFEGAARFADVREGDLSNAKSHEPADAAVRDVVVRNSLPDPLAPVWWLVLMGVAVCAWRAQERGV